MGRRERVEGVVGAVGVVLAAAGRGERLGGDEPKPFRAIGGVPMLLRAIRPFAMLPSVRHIVVALPKPYVTTPPPWLAAQVGERLTLTEGGSSRAQSVCQALERLDATCSIVLVHDAARPLVTSDTIEAVLRTVAGGTAAVAALPVTDTLKRAGEADLVHETVDRSGFWRAQTPQGFPRQVLEAAFRAAATGPGVSAYTDEAAMVEAAGFPVRLVPDRATNIKVTTADDLELAEALTDR